MCATRSPKCLRLDDEKKKEAFCDNLQHDDMKRPIFSFLQQRRNTKVNRSIAIFPSIEFEPIYIRSQQAEIIAKPRTVLMRKVLCRIDVFLKFPLSFITRSLVNIYKPFPLLLWGRGRARACFNLCRNATQARTEKKHTHVAPQALPGLAWNLQRNARDIRASRVTPVVKAKKIPEA